MSKTNVVRLAIAGLAVVALAVIYEAFFIALMLQIALCM